MLANFKPGRGDYYSDGFTYTAPVGQYYPNDFGLYDMSGNVAEWCEDAYSEATVPIVWDLNPTYYDDNEPRKIVRGGSWKDIAHFLETGVRNFEYQDSARSFIGFRSAMIYIGRSSDFDLGR
jgi:formylglycine-generating enzyme required for sulfatase activity